MNPIDHEPRYTRAREQMVAQQIEARGITNSSVLRAMGEIPRHRFVPVGMHGEAYSDHPLPIGLGQTISQPYIVAFMAEALRLIGSERVLEVGAGSGYMASILGRLAMEIHAIELEEMLAAQATSTLQELGITNVFVHVGDGRHGWSDAAPYDAIMLSCATSEIPPALLSQLAEGGRMILPLGTPNGIQELVLLVDQHGKLEARPLLSVVFVPLRKP